MKGFRLLKPGPPGTGLSGTLSHDSRIPTVLRSTDTPTPLQSINRIRYNQELFEPPNDQDIHMAFEQGEAAAG